MVACHKRESILAATTNCLILIKKRERNQFSNSVLFIKRKKNVCILGILRHRFLKMDTCNRGQTKQKNFKKNNFFSDRRIFAFNYSSSLSSYTKSVSFIYFSKRLNIKVLLYFVSLYTRQ